MQKYFKAQYHQRPLDAASKKPFSLIDSHSKGLNFSLEILNHFFNESLWSQSLNSGVSNQCADYDICHNLV